MSILRALSVAALALISSGAIGRALSAQDHHPIRGLFKHFSACLGNSLFGESGKFPKINLQGRWRDDARYWRTGDPDFVNPNPNDGRYEVFRAQYDGVRHILILKHDMYEDAEVIVAAAGPFSFSSADLRNVIPIKGLQLGQTRSQVERVLGRGFREDHCGMEQYYYRSPTASFLVLTYKSGKLIRFFGGFYTD